MNFVDDNYEDYDEVEYHYYDEKDIYDVYENGYYTQMEKALNNGDLKLVHSLIDKCFDEEKDYTLKMTTMHFAAAHGNHQLVTLLCEHNFLINKENNRYNTPLHIGIMRNHLEVFKILLKNSDLNAQNFFKETPLHIAVLKGRPEFVELLIKSGANVNIQNSCGQAPLNVAARGNNIQIVKILLENGAKIDQGETGANIHLYCAAENRNMEMIKLLLTTEYCTIETKKKACKNALPSAVKKGNLEIVKYLIDYISESTESDHDSLQSNTLVSLKHPLISEGLLDISLSIGNLEVWKYLLRSASKIDRDAYTELHFAVQKGQVASVKEIIKQKKSDSSTNRLAVYIAVECGNEEILQILLDAGYSVESCYDDRTPLHIASTFEHPRLVKMLLKAGADIESKTKNNETPLVYAALAVQSDVVKFLINKGASVGSHADDYTPLVFAALIENTDMVEFLLDNMAEVISKTRDFTPVIFATAAGLSNVLQFLRMFSNPTNKFEYIYSSKDWTVTPSVFQNLLKIIEILLIGRTNNDGMVKYDNDGLFNCVVRLRVCEENKEESLEEDGPSFQKETRGKFRPEILRCMLNCMKDKGKEYMKSLIENRSDFCTQDIISILLEYNNYKISAERIYADVDYKSNVLLIGHASNSCLKQDLILQTIQRSTQFKDQYDDILKLIGARLCLILSNFGFNMHKIFQKIKPKLEKKKVEFFEKHNIKDWEEECEQQMKSMQETKIADEFNISFYDILTQPVNKTAIYLRKEILLKTLESSYVKFPAYAELLMMSVEIGKQRRELIEMCNHLMFNFIHKNYKIQFSVIHVNLILRYLSSVDMRCLSAAFSSFA